MILAWILVFLGLGTIWLITAMLMRASWREAWTWTSDHIYYSVNLIKLGKIQARKQMREQESVAKLNERQRTLDPMARNEIMSQEGQIRIREREIAGGFFNLVSYYASILTLAFGLLYVFVPKAFYFGSDSYILSKYRSELHAARVQSTALDEAIDSADRRFEEYRNPYAFAEKNYDKKKQRELMSERQKNAKFAPQATGIEGIKQTAGYAFKKMEGLITMIIVIGGIAIIFGMLASGAGGQGGKK